MQITFLQLALIEAAIVRECGWKGDQVLLRGAFAVSVKK
jgi:hypothetical protein